MSLDSHLTSSEHNQFPVLSSAVKVNTNRFPSMPSLSTLFGISLFFIPSYCTIIQLPEVCNHTFNINSQDEDSHAEFEVSFDYTKWDIYSRRNARTCIYYFERSPERNTFVKVQLNISSDYNLGADSCPFDILLYSLQSLRSQYIKKLNCSASGLFDIPWPSQKLVIIFPLRSDFTNKPTTSSASAVVRVGFVSCTSCGFEEYGFTQDDFNESQIPYYQVSAQYQCGTVGCLENVLQGYRLIPYVNLFENFIINCSLILNTKPGTTVCIKQEKQNSLVTTCSIFPAFIISIYVAGQKYLELDCNDVLEWWCMPWDVGGKQLLFLWDPSEGLSGIALRDLLIVSPSANRDRQCDTPNFANNEHTTTTMATWSTWNDGSPNDPGSSADNTVYGVIVVVVVVIFFIVVGCCAMCIRMRRGSMQTSMPQRAMYNPQTATTTVTQSGADMRNPVYTSSSHSSAQLGVSGFTGHPQAPHVPPASSAPNYSTSDPAPAYSTLQNITPTPPLPPSYDEVMKNTGQYDVTDSYGTPSQYGVGNTSDSHHINAQDTGGDNY